MKVRKNIIYSFFIIDKCLVGEWLKRFLSQGSGERKEIYLRGVAIR